MFWTVDTFVYETIASGAVPLFTASLVKSFLEKVCGSTKGRSLQHSRSRHSSVRYVVALNHVVYRKHDQTFLNKVCSSTKAPSYWPFSRNDAYVYGSTHFFPICRPTSTRCVCVCCCQHYTGCCLHLTGLFHGIHFILGRSGILEIEPMTTQDGRGKTHRLVSQSEQTATTASKRPGKMVLMG